jgi:hypothetical protein
LKNNISPCNSYKYFKNEGYKMSYKFGQRSLANLSTCHPKIQEILNEAIQYIDFTVTCGTRSKEDQDKAFADGNSKLKWPNSKHNSNPSRAADVAPYPIDWNDIKRFAYLMGIIKGIAHAKGIKIVTGCDWDSDGDITDHKFMDWPHFELHPDEE